MKKQTQTYRQVTFMDLHWLLKLAAFGGVLYFMVVIINIITRLLGAQ